MQRWMYLALICEMYFADGFLPNDDEVLWSLADCPDRGFWKKHGAPVRACFEPTDDGHRLTHTRVMQLIESVEKKPVRQVPARSLCISLSSSDVVQGWFLKAYENYPRHIGKRAAEKAFFAAVDRVAKRRKISAERAGEVIAEAAGEYAAAPAGQRGKYTPHMSTWLNQDRFDDSREEWQGEDARPVAKSSFGRALDELA